MKPTLDHMPSLDHGESPWTETEQHVREALRAAEVPPPSDLESKVMKSLDAAPTAAWKPSLWMWGAAGILVGGLAVSMLKPESSPQPETAADSVIEVVQNQTSTVDSPQEGESEGQLEWRGEEEAAASEALESPQDPFPATSNEAPPRLQPMETMGERAVPVLESSSQGLPKLEQEAAKSRLERRPATLEVKQ